MKELKFSGDISSVKSEPPNLSDQSQEPQSQTLGSPAHVIGQSALIPGQSATLASLGIGATDVTDFANVASNGDEEDEDEEAEDEEHYEIYIPKEGEQSGM